MKFHNYVSSFHLSDLNNSVILPSASPLSQGLYFLSNVYFPLPTLALTLQFQHTLTWRKIIDANDQKYLRRRNIIPFAQPIYPSNSIQLRVDAFSLKSLTSVYWVKAGILVEKEVRSLVLHGYCKCRNKLSQPPYIVLKFYKILNSRRLCGYI